MASVSQWPQSHSGLSHTVASVTQTQWPQSHSGLSHTVASVTQWPQSHSGLRHTVASITQWPQSHSGLSHTVASVTQWPQSHSGLRHTVASVSQWLSDWLVAVGVAPQYQLQTREHFKHLICSYNTSLTCSLLLTNYRNSVFSSPDN